MSIWQAPNTAVVLVDFQKDFTEEFEGKLAVPGTDHQYIEKVKNIIKELCGKLPIFATKDYHPPNHVSFISRYPNNHLYDTVMLNEPYRSQLLWPDHCVKNSSGAELIIEESFFTNIIEKGTHQEFDSYSGFFDDGGHETTLNSALKNLAITDLIIFGLALEYCVAATALDALKLGFNVRIASEYCRAVNKDGMQKFLDKLKKQNIIVS